MRKKEWLFLLGSVTVFGFVFLLALAVGKYPVSLADLVKMIFSTDGYDIERSIVANLRLPRTIMAALTGVALSISGLLYQEVFQNKLVSPDLLGVSSGAGVGAAIAILLGLPAFVVSGFAFCFGIAAVAMTILVSKVFRNSSSVTLVLAGVIVSGFMGAVLSFIKYLADVETTLASITFWLMGSFEDSVLSDVWILLPIVAVCSVIVLCIRWRINVGATGEEEATTRGIPYRAYRYLIIGLATLLTASSVAFSGTISWIGLVIPHIVRLIVGRNTKYSIPLAVSFGAVFMVLTDIVSRTFTASEIPLSAVTGLFGTLVFVLILYVRRDTVHE